MASNCLLQAGGRGGVVFWGDVCLAPGSGVVLPFRAAACLALCGVVN